MRTSLDQLLERARYLGVHELAYPIDIFSIATEISEHPDAGSRLSDILELVSDSENHFTRWASIRAISQIGGRAIEYSKMRFEERLEIEDYELAAKELRDALAIAGNT